MWFVAIIYTIEPPFFNQPGDGEIGFENSGDSGN